MTPLAVDRNILSLPAASGLLLLIGLTGCNARAAADMQTPVPVSVAIATRGPQALSLSGLGHVQGLDTASARAQTSGEILSVSFREGQTVQAGQPLAQIDARPIQATLAQDAAALARDRAAWANAADNVNRAAPLVSQGLASAQQVEGYRSQAAQLAATVAGDRATIQRDRLLLGYTTIRAPISGVTGVRQIDPGNVVSPTDPIGVVSVVQIQPIAVTFTLPQSAITRLRVAIAAAGPSGLAVDALAQGSGQTLDHGRLEVIDNHIDDTSGTVTLKAVFPNAARLLWPGQLLTARIEQWARACQPWRVEQGFFGCDLADAFRVPEHRLMTALETTGWWVIWPKSGSGRFIPPWVPQRGRASEWHPY